MRIVSLALVAALVASVAHAQPVEIPFRPELPATFDIVEVRTKIESEGGNERVRRGTLRYALEMRSENGGYEAMLSASDAEIGELGPGGRLLDLAQLVGTPVLLELGASGEPTGMRNWEEIRERLEEKLYDEDQWDLIWDAHSLDYDARRAAFVLAAPLAALAPCHNSRLQVAVPERRERSSRMREGGDFVSQTTRELRSMDLQAGTAAITMAIRQGTRRNGGEIDFEEDGMHVECIVDLRSGMARSAVLEVNSSSGQRRSLDQFEFTISRR